MKTTNEFHFFKLFVIFLKLDRKKEEDKTDKSLINRFILINFQ